MAVDLFAEPQSNQRVDLFSEQENRIPSGYQTNTDTSLDYMTASAEFEHNQFSIYSDQERLDLMRKGPIKMGEAFQRQNKWELVPFQFSTLGRAMNVKGAADRLQADEYTDETARQKDIQAVTDYMRKLEEEQIRGYSYGAKVYHITSAMPAFAAEFAATGFIFKGAITGARVGAGKVAEKAAERVAAGAVKKIAVGAAKASAEMAVRTSLSTPILFNRYGAKYAENQIFSNVAFTDKGIRILEQPQETQLTSFIRAYFDTFIEIGSEQVGAQVFKPAGKAAGGALSKRISPELAKRITKFTNKFTANGKIMEAYRLGGFDGIIEEVGEEYVGDQFRAIFGVEDFGTKEDANIIDRMGAAFAADNAELGVMVGSFAIPGVASYSSQRLYDRLRKRGYSDSQIDSIHQNMSESEKNRLEAELNLQQNQWLASGLTKALAGQELSEEENFALNEKFDEYVLRGWINVEYRRDELPESIRNLPTDQLEDLIEKRYEAGASQRELNLLETEYAARKEIDIGYEDIGESDEIDVGLSLEDILALSYKNMIIDETGGMSQSDIAGNIRSNLVHPQLNTGFTQEQVDKLSDAEVIDVAKKAYEDKLQRIGAKKLSIEDSEKAKAVENVENLIRAYHGTVAQFEAFNREYASVESDLGAGIYFSSDEFDVQTNYATPEGPDLRAKLLRRAEELTPNEDWRPDLEDPDARFDAAMAQAREEIAPGQPEMIEVDLAFKNPVVLGGQQETWLDYRLAENEDDMVDFRDQAWEEIKADQDLEDSQREEYSDEIEDKARDLYSDSGYDLEESGILVDFIEALRKNISQYEWAGSDAANMVVNAIMEKAQLDSIKANEVIGTIKEVPEVWDLTDQDGKLIINEVIRQTFEDIGFDGFIDNTVSTKFRGMNIPAGTTHYIVFDPKQIRNIYAPEREYRRTIYKGVEEEGLDVGKKRYKGKAYRSPTGYDPNPGDTAADVVRFEMDELGNDFGLSEEQIKKLEKYPASSIVWVTRTEEEAERYGEPEEIDVRGWEIIADIGPEGVFVLKPKKPAPGNKNKYDQMLDRIKEIKQSKDDFIGKIDAMLDVLRYFKDLKQEWRNSIRRYEAGKLDEEYSALPKYYRSTKKTAMTMDEVASSLGLERDSDVPDYFAKLDQDIKKTQDDIATLREQRREETQRQVVQKEITNLKQRISDYEAGKKVGSKDLAALKKEVTDAAKDLLPTTGKGFFKRILSAINSVKKPADVPAAIARIVDIYEQFLDKQTRVKAIKQIMKKYKRPQDVMDVEYQQKIEEIRDQLGEGRPDQRKALNKLSTQDLIDLARRINEYIIEGKKSLAQKQNLKDMASEIMRAVLIKASGGSIDIEAIGSREERKAAGKIGTAAKVRALDIFFERPLRLIRDIFGKVGEKLIYDSLDSAEIVEQMQKIIRVAAIRNALKKNNVKTMTLGEEVEINGQTYQITDLMTIYAQRNNEDAKAAIIHGNKISDEQFSTAVNYLVENHPNVAKATEEIQEIIGSRFEEIRRVLREGFNVDLKKVKVYFPMVRQYVEGEEFEDPVGAMDILGDAVMRKGHGVDYAAVEKGFTLSRQKISERNQRPINLDFMAVAMRAIDNQEHFINFAPIQKMYNNIKTDPALRDSIIYNHGESAWNALDRYLNEMINPRVYYQNLDPMSRWAKGVRKALGVFYLGFNLVTVMKQFPSAHLALKNTTLIQLYKSMLRTKFNKDLQKKILALDPSIEQRVVEREIGELLSQVNKLERNDFLRAFQLFEDNLGRESMQWILNMDRWAVMAVFDSVYEHQKKIVGHEEAVKIAHKTVLETQPQGRRVDLPAAYRVQDQYFRMLLMFTNQLNQIWNMMRHDLPAELKRGEKAKAIKGVASVMLSSMMIYVISHGGTWPDDEEEQAGAWFDAIFGSFISSIPIVGNLAMSYVRGYSPSISPLDSIIQSMKWTANKIQNEEYVAGIADIMLLISIAAGVQIPATQLKRTIKGAIDLYEGESGDPRRLIYSSSALNE